MNTSLQQTVATQIRAVGHTVIRMLITHRCLETLQDDYVTSGSGVLGTVKLGFGGLPSCVTCSARML